MWTIEKRCQRRDTTAFVAPDTVDLLGQKMIGIIADRRMTKMHRYLGESSGSPRLFTGLRVWPGGYGGPTTIRPGQSASISLARQTRPFESIGIATSRDDATEEQLRERYHHPEKHWLKRREDVMVVHLDGWPGSPGRDDSICVEYWNENGVGQESIIVFDDIELVEEIAWDAKRDKLRQVCLYDSYCTVHGRHFEHPEHHYEGACASRTATLAENLEMLAFLAARNEEKDSA